MAPGRKGDQVLNCWLTRWVELSRSLFGRISQILTQIINSFSIFCFLYWMKAISSHRHFIMHDFIRKRSPKKTAPSSLVGRSSKSGGALGLCGSDCYLASWSSVQSDAYISHILQGSFLTLSPPPVHPSHLPPDSPHPLYCYCSLADEQSGYAVELLHNLAPSPVNIN